MRFKYPTLVIVYSLPTAKCTSVSKYMVKELVLTDGGEKHVCLFLPNALTLHISFVSFPAVILCFHMCQLWCGICRCGLDVYPIRHMYSCMGSTFYSVRNISC
jgi:hypothetical protein